MPDAVELSSSKPSTPPAAVEVGVPSEPALAGNENNGPTKPTPSAAWFKKLVIRAGLFIVALPVLVAILSFVLVWFDSPRLPQELRVTELTLQLPEDKELFEFDAKLVRYLAGVEQLEGKPVVPPDPNTSFSVEFEDACKARTLTLVPMKNVHPAGTARATEQLSIKMLGPSSDDTQCWASLVVTTGLASRKPDGAPERIGPAGISFAFEGTPDRNIMSHVGLASIAGQLAQSVPREPASVLTEFGQAGTGFTLAAKPLRALKVRLAKTEQGIPILTAELKKAGSRVTEATSAKYNDALNSWRMDRFRSVYATIFPWAAAGLSGTIAFLALIVSLRKHGP